MMGLVNSCLGLVQMSEHRAEQVLRFALTSLGLAHSSFERALRIAVLDTQSADSKMKNTIFLEFL